MRTIIFLGLACGTAALAAAQTNFSPPIQYLLLESSSLLDDCPVCDAISIPKPLRGEFKLVLIEETPFETRYGLQDLYAYCGDATNPTYTVSGEGTLRFSGEVALIQELALTAKVFCLAQQSNQTHLLTNPVRTLSRTFPLVEINLVQAEENPMQYYSLNLVAAPAREIWFSTVQGFHPGTLTNIGTGADLLSSAGHFVKTKAALLASVGIPLPAETLGIDALHLGSGGEIYFSLTSAADSTTLGKLNHGDLLSDRGRVVQSFQMLLTPFSLLPPIPDLGLDAVSVRNDGEILFSIQSTAFSQRVGAMLQSGDVLSSRGAIYRSNRQLLARLQPTQPDQDYGLDALHVWEHGEIWFSVERTFQSQTFGQINPGDLLSDQGLVVFRNLTLMEVFKPKEYLADFGLDALFVVSDLSRSATPGRLSGWQRQGGDLTLHWSGPGRVFSLERAGQLHGPYQPAGVLTPDSSFTDSGALTNGPQAYYRLQQW